MRNKKFNDLDVRKRFGQNFLVDENVLAKIISKADFSSDDFVLEVGPGHGAMTERILPEVKKLVAVEIDRDLVKKLEEKFQSENKLSIISQDFLDMDLTLLETEDYPFKNRKAIGNIPYYITTPIIMKLIDEKSLKVRGISESRRIFSEIILMMQKEVAERLMAAPGTKDYGALSVIGQYACEIESLVYVGKNSFYPRPQVDSMVIRMKLKTEDEYQLSSPPVFWKIVHAVFTSRRKTLRNSLKIAGYTNEQIEIIAKEFDLGIRGETMGIPEFSNLSNYIEAQVNSL